MQFQLTIIYLFIALLLLSAQTYDNSVKSNSGVLNVGN